MNRASILRGGVSWTLSAGSVVAPVPTARFATYLWYTPFPLLTGRTIRRRHADRPARFVPSGVIDGWEIGRGPRTALIVHGWAGSSRQFERMADALADAGFRVFVLDLPAHGSRAGAATDAYQLAGAISAAGAAIGATVDLVVAHSLGVLASVYAMTSPEIRPALGASSMVMVAPGISPDLAMTQFAEGVGMPPNIEARVRAAMEQRFGEAVWTQAPDMIRDIDVPGHILVVHDHDDDRVPFAQGEELARNIEAGFLATSGFGHNGILKAPEVIDAVVAFATIAEHAT